MSKSLRILVVGAGAVGGYFGARMAAGGEDVTFLVRERRYAELQEKGLEVESVHGNLKIQPRLLTTQSPDVPGVYDLLILAVKQYHTEQVFSEIAPFMGPHSVILPLMNGISHVRILQERFGKERVLGGLCQIESTLQQEKIVHTSQIHHVTIGSFHPSAEPMVNQVAQAFQRGNIPVKISQEIEADMWRKWMMISAFSGVTSLIRKPIGPILETKAGRHLYKQLLCEVQMLAEAYSIGLTCDDVETIFKNTADRMPKEMMSSMSRDLLKGYPLELDAIQGAVIEYAREKGLQVPYHEAVYAGLCLYKEGA